MTALHILLCIGAGLVFAALSLALLLGFVWCGIWVEEKVNGITGFMEEVFQRVILVVGGVAAIVMLWALGCELLEALR